jgi:ATP-dependent RNA helicase DDX10/DBP4
MSKNQKGRGHAPPSKKRKRDEENIPALEKAVADLDIKNGVPATFSELPLSQFTQDGLKGAHFTTLTDIQAKAIPLALQGRDVLGAAKTGSGKTLAFLIPVLENLYRKQHVGKEAGLGALIISPTRELAIQIFEVLRAIGSKGHMFSAGLVIGGKSLQEEQVALVRMNIVVCTPGRMLQHMSQTAFLNLDGLQMLVLDEADRILDMGFQRDVDAILDYLPTDRQTMLFSATQTKKVSDLARLSLKDPEYISVHQEAITATPSSLTQTYILTPLPQKLDTLWSFLQTTKKSKILVFLSSGKQVRYVYESLRHLQPGIPLLHLHGRQKQMTRLQVTKRFAAAQASCLFATDVVARGLDFPAVDWVVQVDCPEDADTYIHRVGRTARYERKGQAVLFLDPNEEGGMLKRLEAKKVPIEKVNVRGKKQKSIQTSLQNMCFKDAQLKYLGQKAFTSYVRSIYLQKDREIFHVDKLPLEEYATSLGLPGAPRIKFLAGEDMKARKNAPRAPLADVPGYESDSDESESDGETKKEATKQTGPKSKYDRMFERQNQDVLAEHYNKLVIPGAEAFEDQDASEDDDRDKEKIAPDDFLTVKRRIKIESELEPTSDARRYVMIDGVKEPILIDSKRAAKRINSKKALLKIKDKGTRIVFDDDGQGRPVYEMQSEASFHKQGEAKELRDRFVKEEKSKVEIADLEDKAVLKQKRKEKKDKKREAARQARLGGDQDDEDDDEDGGAVLGPDTGDRDLVAEFLEDTRISDGESEDERPRKKTKDKEEKWFQKKGKRRDIPDELENFEDLESYAAGLLDA